MIDVKLIDKEWTLLLDRDGVINDEKFNDYIHKWAEFKFYDGVLKAINIFNKKFKYIIVITNQRGVGKGVTLEKDLIEIHQNMKDVIVENGGRLDAVYYCKDDDNNSQNRKPNIGMGLQAINDFADIDVKKTIMVGNTMSDMQFGKTLGTFTVFLPTTRPEVNLNDEAIDAVYPSLIAFAKALI